MTIGIDARMLGKGFGLARYVEQLLIQLDTLEHDHNFVLFLREENQYYFKPTSDRFRTVIADIPWYSLKEQTSLAPIINRQRIDLMHFSHFNIPLSYRGDFVVTIHDLTMYHFPRPEATTHGSLMYWIKDRAHRAVVAHAAKHARCIIATSEFTRQDIHHTLGTDVSKITVVYQAPFEHQGIATSPMAPRNDEGGTPYLLYVGAAYPHKNVQGLLDAWLTYIDTYEGSEELVIVGKENYFYDQLKPVFTDYPQVRYLGFQTDEQLEVLYRGARAFVFPSLYEGFGLPPIDAMARGIPVLSSNAACMPEILGSAALYTDPMNPEMFAKQIYTILNDDDVRHEVCMQSKDVLRQYSAERFGKETLAVYDSCNLTHVG